MIWFDLIGRLYWPFTNLNFGLIFFFKREEKKKKNPTQYHTHPYKVHNNKQFNGYFSSFFLKEREREKKRHLNFMFKFD